MYLTSKDKVTTFEHVLGNLLLGVCINHCWS